MANQAWQITRPGVLELKDLGSSIPKPGPKQALIRIHAVSLNYRDKLIIEHSPNYPVLAQPNLVPCSDGAGVVEATGLDSIWKKGDRVFITIHTWLSGEDPQNFKIEEVGGGGNQDGTLRRWVVWDDARLIRVPAHLSMEEASTLFTAGVTAYRALFHGPLQIGPGTTVLTQGTGGVSCFAIQIAAAAGATVVATSSSKFKLEIAEKLGAKYLIDYRKTPDWAAEVLKATDGKGVDFFMDVVGAESIEQALKATRFGGAIIFVGLLSRDPNHKVNIAQDILYGAKILQGQLGAGNKEMGEELSAFMEKHQLHPQVAQVFDFDGALEAVEALNNLSSPGKIVIRV